MNKHFSERMTGGSPAYYVTVKKDKRLKGFYWMVNTKGSYLMLQTVIKTNGMNMTADKAPSVENTPEIRAFMETTVASYKVELPGLEQPVRAVEMIDVLRDLTDRDLVRRDTLGQTLEKQMEEPTECKRNTRLSTEKLNKSKLKEKWTTAEEGEKHEDEDEVSSPEEGATQVLARTSHIFSSSSKPERKNDDTDESGQEEGEEEEGEDHEGAGDSQEEEGDGEDGDNEERQPPAKKPRQSTEKCKGITEKRVEEVVRRVCKKGEENIIGVVEESAAGTMGALDKGYEQSRKGTREIKLAIANCYETIQQGNKLATVTEHNVKELIKAQKVTNSLLAELTKKMERMEKEKDNNKELEQSARPYFKKYCSFCKEGSHDLDECIEKVMCFRCGEFNHKAATCYWLERTCGRCQARGHKRDMHDTSDPDARELLVSTFPKSFTHFLTDSSKPEAVNGRYAERNRGGARGKGSDGRRYRN